ncbi:MAG: M23 family metallopeptidase [Candidatus Cloacimonetes bacterium]|nr:M23 family metallopeptidase [Candidatus Cloacimonadota bacterium]
MKIKKELALLKQKQTITETNNTAQSNEMKQQTDNLKDYKGILEKYIKEQNSQPDNQRESNSGSRFIPDIRPVSEEAVISQTFSASHPGIDLAASTGTEIIATAAGRVEAYENDDYFGNLLVLEHFNGYYTYYGHLEQIYTATGRFAEKGEVIGTVGSTGFSTGPHLHYSIQKDGLFIDPLSLMKR